MAIGIAAVRVDQAEAAIFAAVVDARTSRPRDPPGAPRHDTQAVDVEAQKVGCQRVLGYPGHGSDLSEINWKMRLAQLESKELAQTCQVSCGEPEVSD
jgi:hypothetical protein